MYNLIIEEDDQMIKLMLIKLVYEFFDYLFVNEIYDDIHDIIVVKYIDNNHVMFVQFHLDLNTREMNKFNKN